MTRIIRRYVVWVVIGVVLVAISCRTMFVYSEYQQEKAIAKMISTRGSVVYRYCGPSWVPPGLRKQLPWFDRVVSVTLYKNHTHVELYRLQGLPHLEEVTLDFPNVTEFRIQVLQSLRKLKTLNLIEMHATERRIGSEVLMEVHGVDSQCTQKDWERLQKALPNCTIKPNL